MEIAQELTAHHQDAVDYDGPGKRVYRTIGQVGKSLFIATRLLRVAKHPQRKSEVLNAIDEANRDVGSDIPEEFVQQRRAMGPDLTRRILTSKAALRGRPHRFGGLSILFKLPPNIPPNPMLCRIIPDTALYSRISWAVGCCGCCGAVCA